MKLLLGNKIGNQIKEEFANEKVKISQNQKRLDIIEDRLANEFSNEKVKISQNQKRLDVIEDRLANEFVNEKVKVSQNQERLNAIEDKLKNEFGNEKVKVLHNQERLDRIEERLDTEFSNEKVKVSQNQKRLDVLENEVRAMRRRLQTAYEQKEENIKMIPFNFLNKITNSQSGEDAVMAYVLGRLKIPFESCRYLDLGANRPIEGSNTNFFYQQWASGVLVEANPQLIPELKERRKEDIILNRCVSNRDDESITFYILSDDGLSSPDYAQICRVQKENPEITLLDQTEVKSITVNRIFQEYFQDEAPLILSVDVEGKDREILESIDFKKYRPLLVVIEMIEYSTDKLSLKKDREIFDYMISKGYAEYAFTGINSIFIDMKNAILKMEGTEDE